MVAEVTYRVYVGANVGRKPAIAKLCRIFFRHELLRDLVARSCKFHAPELPEKFNEHDERLAITRSSILMYRSQHCNQKRHN
jgi:hypothetical protein